MKTERELFLYELEGRGYTFENMTWLGNCFEDNFLNMAWEMWCASASREGYKLVPVVDSDAMWSAGMVIIEENGYCTDASNVYKAMIEAA